MLEKISYKDFDDKRVSLKEKSYLNQSGINKKQKIKTYNYDMQDLSQTNSCNSNLQISELNQKNQLREEARKLAEELVSKMTVDEMASQLIYHAPAIERLGIKEYKLLSIITISFNFR